MNKRLIVLYSPTLKSGKGVVSSFLCQSCTTYKLIKIATPLKNMVSSLLMDLGIHDPMAYIEGVKKEDTLPGLGCTGRHLMQTLGYEWGRVCVHPDIWLQVVCKEIAKHEFVVVDDMRFENEYDAFVKMGGIMVKIIRPGQAQSTHATEGRLENHPFHIHLINDGIHSLQDKAQILWTWEPQIGQPTFIL